MKKRKMLEVKKAIQIMNISILNKNYTQEQKEAICVQIEEILHNTGNYNGFINVFPYNDKEEYTRVYRLNGKYCLDKKGKELYKKLRLSVQEKEERIFKEKYNFIY